MVELSKAPVNEAKLAISVVNHDVVGLNITMHDALGVAVVKRLKDLEHVVADVEVVEALVEFAEIGVARVNELGDNGRSLGERIARDADHIDDVGAALQGLQDLELPTDLLLLDCMKKEGEHSGNLVKQARLTWLQNLDDDSLVVLRVDSLIHFRVLSTTNLLNDLEVVLGPDHR